VKPVVVFRHVATEGPGYFATVLERRGIPWRLVAIDQGECVPATPDAFSGLVFMGGPMSVNDDLPWIRPSLALIRAAVAGNVPVLGHCLGSQLMAKALGATVSRNPVTEIGWGTVDVIDVAAAARWFSECGRQLPCFHWHGETFSIPTGATRVLSGPHCANQGFALGPHLALQCHIEMTAGMVDAWCAAGAGEIVASHSPAVQPAASIRAETAAWLPRLQRAADAVYDNWMSGLAR
jgi:GMP synthase-like glutamine amidotransferase